jgi:hypothetical protein
LKKSGTLFQRAGFFILQFDHWVACWIAQAALDRSSEAGARTRLSKSSD